MHEPSVESKMAGGAPVPIPVSENQEMILSVKDLEKAASKKLGKTAGGKVPRCDGFLDLDYYVCYFVVMFA